MPFAPSSSLRSLLLWRHQVPRRTSRRAQTAAGGPPVLDGRLIVVCYRKIPIYGQAGVEAPPRVLRLHPLWRRRWTAPTRIVRRVVLVMTLPPCSIGVWISGSRRGSSAQRGPKDVQHVDCLARCPGISNVCICGSARNSRCIANRSECSVVRPKRSSNIGSGWPEADLSSFAPAIFRT